MKAIEKDIEKYMSEVGSHLFCSRKNKKVILEDIREAIIEFAENNGVKSIDMIYERFGTPEEIAKAYITDAEPQNIKKAINTGKMLIAAVVIAVILLAIALIINITDSHKGNIVGYSESISEDSTALLAGER